MKNLRLLFAGLVLIVSFVACSPNHDEEVSPKTEETENEAFEVKSEHGTPIKKGDDR